MSREKREHKIELAEIEQIRAEIKVSLAGLYTAEKAFFVENGRYTTDIASAGWTPTRPEMRIKVGFLVPFEPRERAEHESPRLMSSDAFLKDARGDENVSYSYGVTSGALSLEGERSYCQADCTADEKHFELMAVADFGNGRNEIWLMNEKKELRQVSDGTVR